MNALVPRLSETAARMKIDEVSFRHCLALFKWIIEGHKLLLPNVSANM